MLKFLKSCKYLLVVEIAILIMWLINYLNGNSLSANLEGILSIIILIAMSLKLNNEDIKMLENRMKELEDKLK